MLFTCDSSQHRAPSGPTARTGCCIMDQSVICSADTSPLRFLYGTSLAWHIDNHATGLCKIHTRHHRRTLVTRYNAYTLDMPPVQYSKYHTLAKWQSHFEFQFARRTILSLERRCGSDLVAKIPHTHSQHYNRLQQRLLWRHTHGVVSRKTFPVSVQKHSLFAIYQDRVSPIRCRQMRICGLVR